ncbi:MAG: Trm112 family protein [Hyphomicrobiaceae bacterium]
MTPVNDEEKSNDARLEEERPVSPALLELLVCPLTKSSLIYNPESNELISRQARLAYPIVDGIPLMTADAARELTEDDQHLIKP